MSRPKNKKYPARRYALLSLQYDRDPQGTSRLTVTSNPENEEDIKNVFHSMDKYVIARQLVRQSCVNATELSFLCEFFDEVRRELQLLVGPAK